MAEGSTAAPAEGAFDTSYEWKIIAILALTFGGPAQRLFVAGADKLIALGAGGKLVDSRKLSAPVTVLAPAFAPESRLVVSV